MKKATYPRFNRGFFRLKALAIAGFLTFTLFIYACNELDEIGLELVDNRIELFTSNDLPLVAYTQVEDSLLANFAEFNLLGFINDPLFGKTRASINAEALPRNLPPSIVQFPADELRIDSVILSLGIAGYFGDTLIPHNIRIFELLDTIPRDSIFSNKVLQRGQQISVSNAEFLPMPKSSVFLISGEDSIEFPPHLRFNLDHEFGRRFIRDRGLLELIEINDQFRGYFKGFHISVDQVDQQPGSMLYLSLRSAISRFQVFYGGADTLVSHVFELYMDDPVGRRFSAFENFSHEFAADIIRQQVIEQDTLLGDSLLFLQSMSNYRVKIQLRDIEEFISGKDGDIAINSARLIIPIDPDEIQDTLDIARNLFLFREDPNIPGSTTGRLIDEAVSQVYFGGGLNNDKTQYAFNITQHLQRIIDDPSNNTPLYLRVSGSVQNAGRVVVKGPGRDNPIRVEIKYTAPAGTAGN